MCVCVCVCVHGYVLCKIRLWFVCILLFLPISPQLHGKAVASCKRNKTNITTHTHIYSQQHIQVCKSSRTNTHTGVHMHLHAHTGAHSYKTHTPTGVQIHTHAVLLCNGLCSHTLTHISPPACKTKAKYSSDKHSCPRQPHTIGLHV